MSKGNEDTAMCRAIIAEDNATIRHTLRHVVEKHCKVIAEAEDGQAAVELAAELRPDIVLLDIAMPFLNGFEAAHHIRNQHPNVRIIFVSSHADADSIDQAFRCGAQGYVVKMALSTQLPDAITEVTNGRLFRPANIAGDSW